MQDRARDAAALLPLGDVVFQILLALADGERHGYGIMQEVATRTGGGVRLGPGTLYGAMKRMVAQDLVEPVVAAADDEGDERRRYYRLTGFGREVARLEVQRLERLVASARRKRLVAEGGGA